MPYSLSSDRSLVYIEGVPYDRVSLWQWIVEEREKESSIYADLVHIYIVFTKGRTIQ